MELVNKIKNIKENKRIQQKIIIAITLVIIPILMSGILFLSFNYALNKSPTVIYQQQLRNNKQ